MADQEQQRQPRAQAALVAVREELQRHAAIMDTDDRLAQVTLVVKFVAGTSRVRGVAWHEERLAR